MTVHRSADSENAGRTVPDLRNLTEKAMRYVTVSGMTDHG